ncbi:DNA internalization-related competence protein ComEC/Rec2 [Catenovulum sediminis]|uniref:DNA internalization-related competence protein ComEC/Rec2 n=1 Tax=Catenovulum sediminis TaxID=1740262 RepID=A0ABV1RE86_9ALTE
MEACLIAFIAGNLVANNFPILFSNNELLVTFIVLSAAIILRQRIFASLLAGLCSVMFMQSLNHAGTIGFISKPVQVNVLGYVSSIPEKSMDSIKFNFVVLCQSEVNLVKHWSAFNCQQLFYQINSSIRLSWYKKAEELKQGQVWALKVKLKPPSGFVNEAGFDYKKWLISESISATGYVVNGSLVKDQTSIRQHWFQQLVEQTRHLDFQDLILALAMGERQLMSATRWLTLKKTGTAHLLAISGLHIGLVFVWLWLFCRIIFRLLVFITNLVSAKNIIQKPRKSVNPDFYAILLALAGAWMFVGLTGFALSAIRAGVFLTVLSVCWLLATRMSWRLRFLLATAVVLLIFPLSPLSISFWLSFGAAAAVISLLWSSQFILTLGPHSTAKVKREFTTVMASKIMPFIFVQVGLLLLLLPLQVVLFQHISIAGLVANLLAIPLVSLFILPCVLLACILFLFNWPLAGWLFEVANLLLEILWAFLTYCAEIKYAYLSLPAQSLSFWSALALGLLLLLLPIGRIYKLPLLLIVSLLFWPANKKGWYLHILDVGQGLAVIVEHQGEAIVYDTGDAFSSGFNLFEAVVEPVLIKRRLQVKAIVISHNDKDHAGGLKYIHNHYPEVPIFKGALACNSINTKKWLALNWWAYSWQVSGVEAVKSNNRSCVIRVGSEKHSVLLTGDIELLAEQQFLQRVDVNYYASDFMLVPHHGSKTSSSEAFIQAISPHSAIISRGRYNRFNHPHKDVIERYRKMGIDIYDTAQYGQISLYFNDAQAAQISYQLQGFWLPWHRKVNQGDLFLTSD